ncbi:MAG: tagatose 1,6-diphosphate aldolase, partial [Chloroflexi bacterium]|nr:tagatose 1,6-diphosphate aldolase [Chloroflexota bacterium]
MPASLSPGRYRGLKNVSLPAADAFGIVAFDQRGSYRKMMGGTASYAQLCQVKTEIISALSQSASAVLTDPVYGMAAALTMSPRAGLLLALEKSGYSGDSSYRKTELIPSWTPQKIRQAGADAVKFMVYYHPESGALAEKQEALIATVVAQCHACDLPVFLEPMSYSLDAAAPKNSAEFAETRPAVVIETARRLSRTGADVLKLESPHDIAHNPDESAWRAACEQVSEASAVPWALNIAGYYFAKFERLLREATAAAGSGF